MNARAFLQELRRRGVSLEAQGDRLVVEAPAEVYTDELRTTLSKHKPRLLELLKPARGGPRRSNRSTLVIRWSEYPVWIKLRDPATGEWHEIRASECLPSIVEAADTDRRRGGGA